MVQERWLVEHVWGDSRFGSLHTWCWERLCAGVCVDVHVGVSGRTEPQTCWVSCRARARVLEKPPRLLPAAAPCALVGRVFSRGALSVPGMLRTRTHGGQSSLVCRGPAGGRGGGCPCPTRKFCLIQSYKRFLLIPEALVLLAVVSVLSDFLCSVRGGSPRAPCRHLDVGPPPGNARLRLLAQWNGCLLPPYGRVCWHGAGRGGSCRVHGCVALRP